jgi:hypothetical protein
MIQANMSFNSRIPFLGCIMLHASEGLPSSWSTLQARCIGIGSCMSNDRLITTGTRVLYFTTSRLQEATQQHTMVHPMVYCQAAAGLHSTKGCSLHSSVSSSQLQADSNHALPRVPPLVTVVGVKASHGSYELACKREVRFLEGSGYSFHLLFRGWRTLLRDRIQRGRLAQSRASCWTERP